MFASSMYVNQRGKYCQGSAGTRTSDLFLDPLVRDSVQPQIWCPVRERVGNICSYLDIAILYVLIVTDQHWGDT